jgi:hypothetical protein
MIRQKQSLILFVMWRFCWGLNHSSIVAIRTNNLTKFNRLRDVFICDFVVGTKMCEGEIYELYIDLNTRFKFDAFEGYKVMLAIKHDSIIMH